MKYQTRRRIADLAHTMDVIRKVVLGVLFWGIIIVLVLSLFIGRSPAIRNGSLLLVNPDGELVDSYTIPVNYRGIPVSGFRSETLLDDLITALDHGASDPRIIGAWVRLDNLTGGGTAAVGELAEAVARFRDSGKAVVASADTFDNSRYRVASAASHIVVDRLGEVFPVGFGSWRPYFGEGLEKLGAKADLFRSGESKTGAENYLLSEMSEAARRDERRLLGDLWDTWIDESALYRGLESAILSDWVNRYDEYLIASGGDGSKAALDAGLVDSVEIGGVLDEILISYFGDTSEHRVDALDYVYKTSFLNRGDGIIAVVPVVGTLVYGEGGSGLAGSRDIAESIRTARDTRGVEALVIRIDSPGGDVRAGEEIRRVLEETREKWNLPIVASMGNLAASGGYWIAVESDLIVTRPDTITGSIGVYSLSLSFEEALSKWLGIKIDGLGTTPWSGAGHPGRSLDERTASLYEAGVADIDRLFRNLVSEKRSISAADLAPLAGGIPWSGRRALDAGLADQAGGLNEARRAAADLAGLDRFQSVYFVKGSDPRTEFLGRLLWGTRTRAAAKTIR